MKQFVRISVNRMMVHYAPKLVKSLESLAPDELWLHEFEHMNAIGGIALHICEHVNRHSVRYGRVCPDIVLHTSGSGIESYFPDGMQTEAELVEEVAKAFRTWRDIMQEHLEAGSPESRLDMNDIYHLVEHTGYHLGQIVDRCQRLNRKSFQFMQNGLSEQALKEILDKSG